MFLTQMIVQCLRPLLLITCLLHLLLVKSAPLDPNMLVDDPTDAESNHNMERRSFLQISSGADINTGTIAERSKEFGVGNNFVRHLRLLTRMSKRRRPFLGARSLFAQDADCINN